MPAPGLRVFATAVPLPGMFFSPVFPCAGRDWGQEEKGTTEDEIAAWHH